MANIKCRYNTYHCKQTIPYGDSGERNACLNAYCFSGDEEETGYCDEYEPDRKYINPLARGASVPCLHLMSEYHEFDKNVKSYELDIQDRNRFDEPSLSELSFRGTRILVDDMEYLEIDGRILIGADNEKEESE